MYAAVFLIAMVSTSYTRMGYCQLPEEAYDLLQKVEFKWSPRWLSRAYVRSCNYSIQGTTKELHNDNIDIWHINSNTIELCTTLSNDELLERYNLHCHVNKKLKDLMKLEDMEDYSFTSKQPHHTIHSRASNVSISKNKSSGDDLLKLDWFDKIHNLTVIESWYKRLAAQYKDLVHINNSIGRTERRQSIFAVHISHGQKPSKKPKIYLQCLLHAREWISGSVCMYISHYLVKESHRKQVSKLLNQLEFILVPVANPDGYAATWFRYPLYRYWRKNLAGFNGTNCLGVDLNRNFDVDWSKAGTSSDPCNATYGGPSAQSELEVQIITAYILKNKPVYGAIDFHSYGQLVLYPHGWTTDLPVYFNRLKSLAMGMSERIQMANGSVYSPQRLASIYSASGTFCDWAYKEEVALQNRNVNNVSYRIVPITMELRPKEREKGFLSGFLVYPNDILPTCMEMINAVKWFSKKLLNKPLKL